MENPDCSRLQLNRRACTTRRQLSSALRDAASWIALAISRLQALLSSATVITDLDARPTVRAIAAAACSRAATIIGSRTMENDNRSSPLEHIGYTRKHVGDVRVKGYGRGGGVYLVAATPRLWQRHVVSVCYENGRARVGRNHNIAMVKSVLVATPMKFSSHLPPDAAKSTRFTTRPQLRRYPLQRIQPVIAKSNC